MSSVLTAQDIDVFLAFEAFDFDTTEFNDGLLAVLKAYQASGQHKLSPQERNQLVAQTKLYYFSTKTGNILDLLEYFHWKKSQQQAKLAAPADTTTNSGHQDQSPTYSSNYQNIVELILSGKPIPGIKKIPNTVLKESSKSVKQQRKKPWELK
ncbi:uncharacterized protein ASCRUDRAFT_14739 [Ascoidea rubescens DSM 1968]|uniref:Uncharacterized protein n=1 Tax=Ascoidea rubescens DSM 1968 TaxID=1344418 RepID=A0A1D2VDK4_9ASCO|nr:hypothetical protein ASCRUDRAFT_14739 [Ascoidea rubescens DSM 1968]ODV59715.1 hypothetical protein ASCRUDRAFT_14739 [Ascoidea rubescens DSM 1968]